LDVSRTAVSNWSKKAGIDPPGRRPCGICAHPQRDEIDAALITESVESVRRRFSNGLKLTMLDRHRRLHLAMPVGRGYGAYPACKVCDHPKRPAIDQALRDGKPRRALVDAYGQAFTLPMLRHHVREHLNNPRRDAAVATARSIRRQAAERLADRGADPPAVPGGPPPGFFFCPECDSENVRCKGDGNWRDDPGPVYWHVTECLDCGWPDA
jgi:hypothetical protein